jgi:hypothetical protein
VPAIRRVETRGQPRARPSSDLANRASADATMTMVPFFERQGAKNGVSAWKALPGSRTKDAASRGFRGRTRRSEVRM